MSKGKFSINMEHAEKLYKGGMIKEDTFKRVQKYASGGVVDGPLSLTGSYKAPEKTTSIDPSLLPVNELLMVNPAAVDSIPALPRKAPGSITIGEEQSLNASVPNENSMVEMETPSAAVAQPTQAMPSPAFDQKAFDMMQAGVMKGMEAGAAEGAATASAMNDISNTIREQNERDQKMMADQQLRLSEQETKVQSAMDEYASKKIDPNRMFANKTTGQKVMLAIGVALAGMNGSGAGVSILNNAIDRDIELQKGEAASARDKIGMQRNLYSDMLQRFGDERQASAAAKATALNLAELELKSKMAQLQGVRVQAEGMKALGELQMMKAKAMQDFRNATLVSGQFATADDMTKKILSLPKEMQGEAFKELAEYNSIQSNLKRVDQVMDEAAGLTTIGSNIKSPIQSKNQREMAFGKLFPIAKAIAGERMTDSDARNLVEPFLPGLLDNDETIRKKKQGLIQALKAQVSGRTPRLSGLGLIPRQQFTEKAAK